MLRLIFIIIVILFVLSIVGAIVGVIAENAKAIGAIILMILVLVVCWKAAGTKGILGFIVVLIALGILAFIASIINEHDKEKKQLLEKQIEEQKKQDAANNEAQLVTELNANYKKMGYITLEDWRTKLPNYVSKAYTTSFDCIVEDFTKQIQEQKITKNKDWLEPFVMYILAHEQGVTVNKLLAEVKSKDLAYTHYIDDRELLDEKLREGTVSTSKDVPALFEVVSTAAGDLYKPTKYLKKLYGVDKVESANCKSSMTEEISFDDL